jgi:DNA-binding winged helix-turn-helix (wHTH) protein/tetratricopeptide (TPR) repeat protein
MVYRFETSELDTARRELRRDGVSVDCEPKVYEVLAYLAAHAERVVSHLELRTAVWHDEVLSEGVLARSIWAARRAVGDNGRAQRVIRTVQRHGYRFVAPIVSPTPPARDASAAQSERATPPLNEDAPVSFVGRETELAELDRLLHSAIRGSARIAWVSGEAGAGKTRLAEEFARLARRRGAQVHTGQVPQPSGVPPYWLWCELLEPIFETHPREELELALAQDAAILASVFRSLRERFPDLSPPVPLDSGEGRFRFFMAVRRFIHRLARSKPLLLICEDAQWADPSSLLLLRFLAESREPGRWLLLVALRSGEIPARDERREICEAIRKEPMVSILALGGLPPEEIARLGELTAGRELSVRWTHELAVRTEGNPLMIIEFVRLLQDRGALDRAPVRTATLPSGARATIERRLDRLSDACLAVLMRAAVLGRSFEADLLAATCDRSSPSILSALDEATSAHVIEEADSVGSYRFGHALLREVVYARLTTSQRVEFHCRAGRELEQRYAGSQHPPLAALIHHFSQSPFHGELERTIDYAVRAAQDAMRMLAHPEAIELYLRALESMERMFPLDDERFAPLLHGLALAQRGAGRHAEAIDTYGRLIVQARRVADPERFAHAVLGLEEARYIARLGAESSIPLLEEALRGLPLEASTLRVHVWMALATKQTVVNDPRRYEISRQALALARQSDDPLTLSTALLTRHWTIWSPHSQEERFAIHRELLALADRVGEGANSFVVDARIWGQDRRMLDLMESGNTAQLDAAIEGATVELSEPGARTAHPEWLRIAQDTRLNVHVLHVRVFRATLAIMQGRFVEAERERSALSAEAHKIQSGNTLHALDLQLFGLRYLQGRVAEVLPLIRTTQADNPGFASLAHAVLAISLASTGLSDEAHAAIEELAATGFSNLPHDGGWLVSLTFVSEALFLLESPRHAREIYTLLEPFADRNALWVRCYCGGAVPRYLGQLATLLGDYDAASRHFETALQRNREMKAAPFVALTEHDHACMLARQATPSRNSRAMELLASAIRTAEKLDMRALRDRAHALEAGLRRRARRATRCGNPRG